MRSVHIVTCNAIQLHEERSKPEQWHPKLNIAKEKKNVNDRAKKKRHEPKRDNISTLYGCQDIYVKLTTCSINCIKCMAFRATRSPSFAPDKCNHKIEKPFEKFD